jgi:hypothetical protein
VRKIAPLFKATDRRPMHRHDAGSLSAAELDQVTGGAAEWEPPRRS